MSRPSDLDIVCEAVVSLSTDIDQLQSRIADLTNDRNLWRRIYAGMIFVATPKSDDGEILPDELRAVYSCTAAEALLDELEKREGQES